MPREGEWGPGVLGEPGCLPAPPPHVGCPATGTSVKPVTFGVPPWGPWGSPKTLSGLPQG